ncbi:MAG: gliding motility-associated C-terminal domain-containing protein [Flavobacteriales bacterium]
MSGGSALPGTPCDDGNESTINDTWNASCSCEGVSVNCTSDAGPDGSTCEATIQLQASGIGVWTGPAGISFVDPTDPTTLASASAPGPFELTWTVSVPGCTATDVMIATFNVGIDPAFDFALNNICTNSIATTPWTANLGGTFTSDPGLVINASTGEVDPSTSIPGDYTVRHAFGGACPTQTERSISIVSTPDATWAVPDPLCTNIAPIDLNAMITGDTGGTWSGQGITGHFFDPNGRVGENSITYVAENNGCTSSTTGSITVVSAPNANAGPDASVCGNEYVLHGAMSSGLGQWTAPPWIELVPNGPGSAIATNVALGTHQFIWTVTDGACTASDAVLITFLDPGTHLDVDAGPDQELEVVLSTFLNATVTPGASVQWSLLNGSGSIQEPNATSTGISGLSVGWNTFIITASLGQCVGDIDTVRVHIRDLFIPQGFSPNQDGDNDLFEVTGLGAYPGSMLTVFNRWGQKVYENGSYNNEWDGRSHNGQELPNDTYFYVLNLSGADTYNGFVVIKR